MNRDLSVEEYEEVMYTAFLKNEEESGFIHYEYGQGEQLLFVVPTIEEADFYCSKESILEELQYEDTKYEVEFYEKKIETRTSYRKVL